MSKTGNIIINSTDRTLDSRSTSDFTFSLGESILVNRIALTSVSIPNTQYNINSNANVLVINDGSSDITITIPEGQYSITQLIPLLELEMQTALADPTLTITIDENTAKLTFAGAVPFQVNVDPDVSTMAEKLGFGRGDGGVAQLYPTTGIATTMTAPGSIALNSTKNYYIVSRTLSEGNLSVISSGQQYSVVSNVPVTEPYGSIVHWQPHDYHLIAKTFSRPTNINWIDIKIYSSDWKIADLEGANVEMVFKIMDINE